MNQELSRLDILKIYKKKLIEFLDALIERFNTEGDLVVLKIFLEEQIPIDDVVKILSTRLIPAKDMILSRDEKFFIEGTDIFSGVSNSTVSYCKDIWLSPGMTKDDKDMIWNWFKLLVILSEKYAMCK
jgi:hypothetical protein